MVMIDLARLDDRPKVVRMVLELLLQLEDEAQDAGELSVESLVAQWSGHDSSIAVLVARDGDEWIGIATLYESFAFYANGRYGIIGEMYITPSHRKLGIGTRLLESAKQYAAQRSWSRLDVTAPEGESAIRVRQFYERQGFTFAGPKLKYLV